MSKQKKNKYKLSVIRIFVFICIMMLLGVSFVFSAPLEKLINFSLSSISEGSTTLKNDYLKIHYIDVGQGDATAIELPDGKTMLIDAGPGTASTNLVNYLLKTLFSEKDNTKIDYFILTHTDEDHVGGAVAVMNKFEIGTVFRPNVYSKSEQTPAGAYKHTSAAWDNVVATIKNKDIRVKYNSASLNRIIDYTNSDTNKNYTFTFYGPVKEKYNNNNDFSPVMILDNNGTSFMFTGDASSAIEQEVMDDADNVNVLDIDVLHIGHHGSKSSSKASFLTATSPEYAIISCGKNNKYGHPHRETIDRLIAANISEKNILRTDIEGSIVAGFNSSGSLIMLGDYYEPNDYYIEWYYVAIGLAIIAFTILFIPGKKRT